ncbi:MAG: haloacid dehalogenase-like hydrolase [Bacteroidales bacterium]|nr:haloacid dehalogenase-like hydrolase [Bacteroidales bacterium]
MENSKPIVAIAYDFDGTLAPGYMQEYDFIPNLKIANEAFWDASNEQAKANDMDGVLSYMFLMLTKAKEKGISIKKEDFIKYGKNIQFFQGVEDYFERINKYGDSKGVKVEHHLISSGLREMVAGTSIAKYFTNIFASGFVYDKNGVACWPALAINYTNKTQFLFRINKGIQNAYDNSLINKRIPKDQRAVPFQNFIYIGDGETDVPAMKMVKLQGGTAITVYNPNTPMSKDGRQSPRDLCLELIRENRADFYAPADYRENRPLNTIVERLIDRIAAEQQLAAIKREQSPNPQLSIVL